MRTDDFLSLHLNIDIPDETIYSNIREYWDKAAKPLDSLGKFEDITARIGAAQRSTNIDIEKKAVVVMCADNGIVEEGVSQVGSEVTLAVTRAMGLRTSSVCKMACKAGIDVFPIDIGIKTDEKIPGVSDRKIAKGTKNFMSEPAMSKDEVDTALKTGINIAYELADAGYKLICTGEMGIGNTTTSTAVACALLKEEARKLTGRGSGLSDAGLQKKLFVIEKAIEKYDLYNVSSTEILRTVGGFDIAALTGLILGAADRHIPIVLDGVISEAAALAAAETIPKVSGYLIASHMSREPAAAMIAKRLGLSPVIEADMALGEGTGAVMMCMLLDTALTLYNDRLSFEDIKIEAYSRF